MSRRPTVTVKLFRSVLSLVRGILLEMAFILWYMILILGAASAVLFLFHLVS